MFTLFEINICVNSTPPPINGQRWLPKHAAPHFLPAFFTAMVTNPERYAIGALFKLLYRGNMLLKVYNDLN